MPGDAKSLREFAERYTAAWCSGEAQSVARFFAPDATLTINAGTPARGTSEIRETVQAFMTAFPDLRVRFDRLEPRDERFEYHWTLTGTNTGPGGSGRPVQISGFELWRLGDDGLIAASEGQFDAEEYRRQVEGL